MTHQRDSEEAAAWTVVLAYIGGRESLEAAVSAIRGLAERETEEPILDDDAETAFGIDLPSLDGEQRARCDQLIAALAQSFEDTD